MSGALVVAHHFPALSETYISNEVAALDRAGLLAGVLSLNKADLAVVDHVPFTLVKDEQDIIRKCRELKPAVLHAHYLTAAPLLHRISEATGVPFTLRTHSFETRLPQSRKARLKALLKMDQVSRLCSLLNDSNCTAVFGFPFICATLRRHGLRESLLRPTWPVVDVGRFLDRSPNGDGVLNLGAAIKKKNMEGYIEFASTRPDLRFSLYPMGGRTQELIDYNESLGSPVAVHHPVQPAEMPAVYKDHNWLVYSASLQLNTVGWPMAVAEAQASGLGVCLQSKRPDAAEYLGGAGFAFRDFREITDLITGPVPQDMRDRGFEVARRSDINEHVRILREAWAFAS